MITHLRSEKNVTDTVNFAGLIHAAIRSVRGYVVLYWLLGNSCAMRKAPI